MKPILVVCDSNWADEMDIFGFAISTDKQWERHLENVKGMFDDGPVDEVYIGTNQSMEFDNFDDYKSAFLIKELTNEELKVIQNVFGRRRGILPIMEEMHAGE